jgi:hypothetical protein
MQKSIGFFTWDNIKAGSNRKGQAAADQRTKLYTDFLSKIEPVGQAMLSRGGWQAAFSGGTSAQDPSWYYAFMNGDFDSSGASGAIQKWISQTLRSPEFAARGNKNWENILRPGLAPLLPGETPGAPAEEESQKPNFVVYGLIAAAAVTVFLLIKRKL